VGRDVSRYDYALQLLRGLNLPLSATPEQERAAASAAYPWGERSHHPYKMWRKATKAWQHDRERLRAFGGLRGPDATARDVAGTPLFVAGRP
jgi:hypothetical protein